MNQTRRDRPLGETSGTSQRPARRLAALLLTFDLLSLTKEVALTAEIETAATAKTQFVEAANGVRYAY